MLTLPLEPTDDRADPIFKDAASCALWLGQLQLTNLQRAHSQLLAQVNELNRYPMRGLERLDTLELLRETAGFVQNDFAKKLVAKPLPLNDSELAAFRAIVQLWQSLATGYRRCLQAYIAGDKQLAKYGALISQRCLLYCGLEIFEYLHTGYEFDASLWHQLHQLYSFAEQQGLHQTEVPDPLKPHQAQSSCVDSYVKTLLACYAHPAELTRWQLQQLDSWLSIWSKNVAVVRSYSLSKNDAQPLATDLAGMSGLQPVDGLLHNDTMRYLAMVPLSKLLRVKTILLQQGQTPRQVALGDHDDSRACVELLTFLHRVWCENSHQRAGERHPLAKHAKLCCKPEGIYAHLSGKPFKQGDFQSGKNRLAQQPAGTPGRTLADAQALGAMGYPLENWQIENESILGARLIRTDATGERLNGRQLLALIPGDAQPCMLGTTIWTHVALNGRLQIGARYLPGLPDPVCVKASGIKSDVPETYAPAFLLPALPSLKTPASLILPRDWFQANRMIEILHLTGEKSNARLGFSVECGWDYERVSFTAI